MVGGLTLRLNEKVFLRLIMRVTASKDQPPHSRQGGLPTQAMVHRGNWLLLWAGVLLHSQHGLFGDSGLESHGQRNSATKAEHQARHQACPLQLPWATAVTQN